MAVTRPGASIRQVPATLSDRHVLGLSILLETRRPGAPVRSSGQNGIQLQVQWQPGSSRSLVASRRLLPII